MRDDGGTDNGGDDTSSVATVNVTVTPVNDSPSASNFTQMYTVGENSGALNFSDIIVTDPDGLDTFTATLTLADHTAGVLSTSNGALFNSATGVWTVSGGLNQVNAALADVTFTPNEGWHGACVISTHLVDSKGAGPSDGVILIEVTYGHSTPISISGTEDVAVVIDGWAYEGSFNPTAIVINDLPEHGLILCNGLVISAPGREISWDQAVSGSITFKGDADWNGTTTFHYSVKDSAGTESAASLVTVILAPEDDAPSTAPFNETGSEDSSIVVDGWVYDGSKDDVAGGSSGRSAMQVTVVTLPGTGTLYHDGVSVTSPNYVIPWADAVGGKVTFIGPEDWNGYTTFDYLVTDTGGHSSASATVTLCAGAVNDDAVVNSFAASTDEDTGVVINGWNYDDSKDNVPGGSLANTPRVVEVFTDAAHGTVYYGGSPLYSFYGSWEIPWEDALNGLLTYKPVAGWSGSDSFTYRIIDQGAYQVSPLRTVYVTVNPVNDAPQIQDFEVSGLEDPLLPIDNWYWYYAYFDDSADGAQASNPSFITIKGLTPAGTIYHNGVAVTTPEYDIPWSERATLEFVPEENWNGDTSVPYTITDEGGAESNQAAITFTISPRNDDPFTTDFSISGHEDTDIVLFGWYFDDSADSVPGGSSMDNPHHVTIEWLPSYNMYGSLYHNGVQITASGYEIPWQDAIEGLVSFRPNPNWNGSDMFSFSVSDDNGGESSWKTGSITVIPVNDRAIAEDFSESMSEDWPTWVTGWGFDDDLDYVVSGSTENTPDHITIVGLPDHGVLSYNSTPITTTGFTVSWAEANTIQFTPGADWNGVTTFHYTVVDDQGEATDPATATLTVTAVDDAPASGDFSMSGQTGMTITVQGWVHDDSEDQIPGGSSANPPDYVTIKWLPANGALYHNGAQITTTNYNIPWADATSGAVTYEVDSWYGSTYFKYDVTSAGGKSSGTPWATVDVVVNPGAGVQDFSSSGLEDTPTSITGWVFTGGGGTTADHVTIESLPLNGTLYYDGAAISATGFPIPWADAITSGKLTFLGTEDWNGSTSFLYSVTDNLGSQSADGAATIQITALKDAPQAGAFTETGTEDITVVINGWMFDDDRDQVPGGSSADSPTEVTIVWLSTHGTLYHDSTAITSPNYQIPWADAIGGTITFQPDADWNGNTEISYTVTDSGGLTSSWSTATICIGTVDDQAAAGAITVSGNEDTIIQLNTWTYSDAADDIYGGSDANTPKFITIEDYPETGYLFHDNEIILHSGYRIPWSDAVTYGNVYFQPFPDWNGSLLLVRD